MKLNSSVGLAGFIFFVEFTAIGCNKSVEMVFYNAGRLPAEVYFADTEGLLCRVPPGGIIDAGAAQEGLRMEVRYPTGKRHSFVLTESNTAGHLVADRVLPLMVNSENPDGPTVVERASDQKGTSDYETFHKK